MKTPQVLLVATLLFLSASPLVAAQSLRTPAVHVVVSLGLHVLGFDVATCHAVEARSGEVRPDAADPADPYLARVDPDGPYVVEVDPYDPYGPSATVEDCG